MHLYALSAYFAGQWSGNIKANYALEKNSIKKPKKKRQKALTGGGAYDMIHLAPERGRFSREEGSKEESPETHLEN